MVKLTPQTAKRGPSEAHPYDHTEDAAPNAAFSRALRWVSFFAKLCKGILSAVCALGYPGVLEGNMMQLWRRIR